MYSFTTLLESIRRRGRRGSKFFKYNFVKKEIKL